MKRKSRREQENYGLGQDPRFINYDIGKSGWTSESQTWSLGRWQVLNQAGLHF
jgi:hypothetical protein